MMRQDLGVRGFEVLNVNARLGDWVHSGSPFVFFFLRKGKRIVNVNDEIFISNLTLHVPLCGLKYSSGLGLDLLMQQKKSSTWALGPLSPPYLGPVK
jgi:hypothetical protein